MKIFKNLNYLAFFSLLLAGIEGKAVTQQINLTPQTSTHGAKLRVPRPATQPKSILELVAAAIVRSIAVYVVVYVVVYAVLSSIAANKPAPVKGTVEYVVEYVLKDLHTQGTVEYVVEYVLKDLHTQITQRLKQQVTPQTKIRFKATIVEELGPMSYWVMNSEHLEYLMQQLKTELYKRYNQASSWDRGSVQHICISFELRGVPCTFSNRIHRDPQQKL